MNTKLGALTKRAAGFDFAGMRLDNTAGEREAEAGAFLACGEERPKDFWKGVGRDAFAVVFDADEGLIVFTRDCDVNRAFAGNGLDAIEHKIQDHLLDERGIVGHGRKSRILRKIDFYGSSANLLPGEHYGLLDRDVEVRRMKGGGSRARIGEKIVEDVLDVENFVLDVRENGAADAVGRKFLPHDIDDAGDAREWITNFVSEAGGEFAQRCQMLGAAHFAAVEFLDFEAVALELFDHFIELPAELADVVTALGKSNPSGQIAAADAGDRVHQIFERALDEDEQNGEKNEAQENGETDTADEDKLRFMNSQGFQHGSNRRDAEEQHRDNRDKDFPLPTDSGGPSHDGGQVHGSISSKTRLVRKGGCHTGRKARSSVGGRFKARNSPGRWSRGLVFFYNRVRMDRKSRCLDV